MSKALLERLQAERSEVETFVTRTLEGVDDRDLSDAEVRTINDARERIAKIDEQIKPLADFVQARSAAADLTSVLSRSERRDRAQGGVEARSMGEQFTASEVFGEYRGRGTSARFTVESRALPTGLPEVADLLPRAPRVDATPPTSTPLLDALSSITVSTNAIETVVWSKTGSAGKVAEKSAKPSVEFTPTVTPFTLDTIAGYTQMTRQMIEDAPAVRDSINGQLVRDVALTMEAEAAAALVAATLPATTGTTLIASIRKGVGEVQAAGYTPGVVLLNPADWADLDIDVFGSTLNGPVRGQAFWGLRPVAASSQPAGTATVADLGAGVQHYRRSGVSLYITDSHGDTFLSNVFTVLAEARAKTIVTRPTALVECTVAP